MTLILLYSFRRKSCPEPENEQKEGLDNEAAVVAAAAAAGDARRRKEGREKDAAAAVGAVEAKRKNISTEVAQKHSIK